MIPRSYNFDLKDPVRVVHPGGAFDGAVGYVEERRYADPQQQHPCYLVRIAGVTSFHVQSDLVYHQTLESDKLADLMQSFAYYTECQLATVEGLRGLKRPPKGELKRHESIAEKMVRVCREHRIVPVKCPRLFERLQEARI